MASTNGGAASINGSSAGIKGARGRGEDQFRCQEALPLASPPPRSARAQRRGVEQPSSEGEGEREAGRGGGREERRGGESRAEEGRGEIER
eukprot:3617904-Rhodomonas_salina.1